MVKSFVSGIRVMDYGEILIYKKKGNGLGEEKQNVLGSGN